MAIGRPVVKTKIIGVSGWLFSICLIVLISLAGNFNWLALLSPLLSAYGSSPTTTIAASTFEVESAYTPLAL